MTQSAITTRAADGTRQPEADAGHHYTMPTPRARTGAEFCLGMIGPATLSIAASQLAVEKATDPGTRQFANFELREAVTVVAILESLNVPLPAVSATEQWLLDTLEESRGREFDAAYMAAQLANHEFLRDLAESYLENATEPAGPDEIHGRHLAALALTAFKEHVVLSQNIARELGVWTSAGPGRFSVREF